MKPSSVRSGGLLLVALLSLLMPGWSAWATWYSENVEDGADIVMMDLRWPWWPPGTYYANWNSGFNPKPNNITFYGGFVAYVPDGPPDTRPNPDAAVQASFRPGSVWTFWGASKDGTPVRFVDVAPNLFIKNDYGGEGSSGTTGAEVWPFVQSRRWYTMLARVWRPLGDSDTSTAYVGRWIKDQADGIWHLIGVARLPIAATSFTGNSGFIEPLEGEKAVRSLNRRRGFFRKDGRWLKSDAITIDKTEYVVVNILANGEGDAQGEEYVAIEYAQRPDRLPQMLSGKPISGDRKHVFTAKQPDLPVLDKPAVSDVRAESTGNQIAVSWAVPDTASPAFAYKIEVFDNRECLGAPKALLETRDPSARCALVDVSLTTATIRLTLTDIFDQSAQPVVVGAVASVTPTASAGTTPTMAGLTYELLQKDSKRRTNYFNPPLQQPDESHYWLNLDEISQGKLVRRGLARGFDLSVKEQRSTGYALVFKGYLRVPEDGLYVIRAQIDGAYRIRIEDQDVLVWDGQHGTTGKAALRRFSKGDHTLEVLHVYDELPSSNFTMEWEGPHLPRQRIPADALRVVDDGSYPVPRLALQAPGDGTGLVNVTVEERGHAVNKTTLFLGSLQLAETRGTPLSYSGAMAAGANRVWARILYGGDHSVDSDVATLNVTGKPVDAAWTVRNISDAKASAGIWQTGTGAFQFFGNGMHTVGRGISGDFTATCRVDGYNGSHGEPVNRRAWVGLAAFEHGERLNWEWGQHFYIVQTAADGLRVSADFTDFGAERISTYELPAGRPWLRVVRQGNVWTAWTSTNGSSWELGAYQFKKAQAQMDVGLFFSALPQDAQAHYHARVSELSVVSGVPDDLGQLTPPVAGHTAGDRLTGVVMARSDSQVVVVRSTSAGLLRTVDGGRTWVAANGQLRGEDLAVRSVAIHPGNPQVMLRATGRGGLGKLWRTTDGGNSWNQLSLDGDFDGIGPSALCGEVLAFDLKDAQILYAGCESKGFFKSTDGGLTWNRLGLVGERVTAVTVWPWERHYPAPAKGRTHLCVTTCPDRWMTYLGRGSPAVTTTANTTRGYVSADNVRTLIVADERGDTGFYSVAFDKAMQSTSEMRYGTAHGFLAQVFSGTQMALYPSWKRVEWLRPMTAVAATAMGDKKFGRFIIQALDPEVPGRLSSSEQWALEWSWLQPKGAVPAGGLIAACGDEAMGEKWWFLHTDGLYFSPDGGAHLSKVLTQTGAALPW